jgi:acyl carrier protein
VTDKTIFDTIRRSIAEVCAVDAAAIQPHSRLLAFGLDSVRLLDLLLAVEESFGLEIGDSDPELAAVETVGDLVALIERRSPAASPASRSRSGA